MRKISKNDDADMEMDMFNPLDRDGLTSYDGS